MTPSDLCPRYSHTFLQTNTSIEPNPQQCTHHVTLRDLLTPPTFITYFKGDQSAPPSEPQQSVMEAVPVCVTALCACWLGACGTDNRGEALSASSSIPNLPLHAKGGVSGSHEGNFRWTTGRAALHHFVRMSLFLWNQTHPHEWHGGLAVIEMSAQERRVELLLVSVSPLLARYLLRDTSLAPSPLSPPPSSSSSLCLSVRRSAVISYTLCTFDQRSWIMVFRFFKVAWICARARKWKANTSPPPSVPT